MTAGLKQSRRYDAAGPVRTAIIINPASGRTAHRRGTGMDRLHLARRVAATCAPDATIVLTAGHGHAAALAQSCVADEVSRVVAWGGDGTVNEVAGPLIGTGTTLGIVPGGSGDGTAGSLGLIRPASEALERALTAEPGRVDVGWLGNRHFLNIAGVGFDAVVATAFNRRRRRGLLTYLRVGLPLFWTYAPGFYRLNIANETRDGSMMLVAFANGPQYGNGLVLAPDANPRDGLLNIVTVRATSRVRFLWQSRLLLFPTDRSTAGVDRRQADTCTVSGSRLVCHVDGEGFEASGILNVRVQPAALWIAGAAAASPSPGAPHTSGDRQ